MKHMAIAADTHKFVVILNKKLETGVALNAASHMAAGLVALADEETQKRMSFIDFVDKDEKTHPSISALSLIVLRGSNGEIRKVRNAALQNHILYTDFLQTMTGDTYIEQLAKTKLLVETELEYYGIALFGEKSMLSEITGKLSLWK